MGAVMPAKKQQTIDEEQPISKPVKAAITRIFDAAFLLNNDAWSLQLAPPGNRFHDPKVVARIETHLARTQSGLTELRRAIREKKAVKPSAS